MPGVARRHLGASPGWSGTAISAIGGGDANGAASESFCMPYKVSRHELPAPLSLSAQQTRSSASSALPPPGWTSQTSSACAISDGSGEMSLRQPCGADAFQTWSAPSSAAQQRPPVPHETA